MSGPSASGLRLAIAAESLTQWKSPQQTLETIRALGCSEVQLCASLFPSTIGLSVPEAWELRRMLDGLELSAESMSTFPYRVGPDRYVDFLLRVLRVAPVLDLRLMNIYLLPFLGAGKSESAVVSDFARAMEGPLDEAAACGVVLSLEPEYFDASRDARGLRRILDVVDHPQMKITYDPCNLYQGGEEAFPYAYEELRDSIAHVHLKNGSVFVEGRHPEDEKALAFAAPHSDLTMRWGPLDEGALNIHGILSRLVRDRYDGVVVLEPHARSLEKQLQFLSREWNLVSGLLAA